MFDSNLLAMIENRYICCYLEYEHSGKPSGGVVIEDREHIRLSKVVVQNDLSVCTVLTFWITLRIVST